MGFKQNLHFFVKAIHEYFSQVPRNKLSKFFTFFQIMPTVSPYLKSYLNIVTKSVFSKCHAIMLLIYLPFDIFYISIVLDIYVEVNVLH